MITEIVEVLAIILEGTKNRHSMDEIAAYIANKKKYDNNLVAAAFSWIEEKRLRDKDFYKQHKNKEKSFRHFSGEEISAIGENNHKYLVHFYETGIITEKDLEVIFEQLSMFPDEEKDTDKINLILLYLFLDMDKNTPSGSRLLLSSSDTIN